MTVLLGLALGLVAGSFVAVVALRWPERRPFLLARSACDGCGATLRWWELVPLASFLALRGRCARCAAAIPRLHLAAELAGGGIGATAFALGRPESALLGLALLLLALTDLRAFWLPDAVTLPLLLAGLALGSAAPLDRAAGAVAGWASLALVGWGYARARDRTGLGAGDAKLFAALGAWLGWRALPPVLLAAALLGLGWALWLQLRRGGVTATTRLPFGTLLAVAGWGAWCLA